MSKAFQGLGVIMLGAAASTLVALHWPAATQPVSYSVGVFVGLFLASKLGVESKR